MSAEPDEVHVAAVPLFQASSSRAEEENALPERASGARGAAALDLDHRRRELDDAGIEVDGAARRQMVRPAGAVHERPADDAARDPKTSSGFTGSPSMTTTNSASIPIADMVVACAGAATRRRGRAVRRVRRSRLGRSTGLGIR